MYHTQLQIYIYPGLLFPIQSTYDGYVSECPFFRGHYITIYYQPKQCTIIREIPENYHRFVLFDPPQYGSHLMTPVLCT